MREEIEKIEKSIDSLEKYFDDLEDVQTNAVDDFLKGLRHLELAFKYGDYLMKSEGWQEGYSFIFDEVARGILIRKSRKD